MFVALVTIEAIIMRENEFGRTDVLVVMFTVERSPGSFVA
jgi:recombinational DNA repair protein (RecF pathway)